MIKTFLSIIVLFFVLITLLSQDVTTLFRGYLYLYAPPWVITLPLWLDLFILIILFIILHTILRLLYDLFHQHGRLKSRRRYRKLFKSYKHSLHGLKLILCNDLKKSESYFLSSQADSPEPAVQDLAIAHVLKTQNNLTKALNYLHIAEQKAPYDQLAIILIEIDYLIYAEKYLQALQKIELLQINHPHHRELLKRLFLVKQKLHQWDEVTRLLPTIKAEKIFNDTPEQLLEIEYFIFKEQLKNLNNIEELITYWHHCPPELHAYPTAIVDFLESLVTLQGYQQLIDLLMKYLQKRWRPELLYYLIQADLLIDKNIDNNQNIKSVEYFLKDHVRDAELYYWLGYYYLYNSNPDLQQAENYLLKSIAITPTRNAYQQLAELYRITSQFKKSIENYQQALLVTVQKLPLN